MMSLSSGGMAAPGQQLQQSQVQALAAGKDSLAPVLQQLNLNSLRTRTQDLHNAIGLILHTLHTVPSPKWSEVLDQFSMVSLEVHNLTNDVKPILKVFVAYPKNVNAENAPILPIMLSSKLLPEMESEEAALKEKILSKFPSSNMNVQSDSLQRQIEAIRGACDMAEKVITEARKVYGLATRQGPVALASVDKMHVARITEQEKLLRVATNFGEGLRGPTDQQQLPLNLPPHLATVLANPTDGRAGFGDVGHGKTSAASVLPPSGQGRSAATPQQGSAAQATTRVQTPAQTPGAVGIAAASPSAVPYVNSPRSTGANFNVPSPQQQQQAAHLQFMKMKPAQHPYQARQVPQQQQSHLVQQQQQLRRPATPPISQLGGQPQAQLAQPLLNQHQQKLQQLQQLHQAQVHPQQAQLQHQLHAQQDRHSVQHLQAQQQQSNLQHFQAAQSMLASNTLQQGNQIRPQMGQMPQMTSLYGVGANNMLASNLYQQGNRTANPLASNPAQRNVSSQMLTDSSTGTQMPQGPSNLGMQMQQQLVNQPNYNMMYNNPAQSNFVQNRQQPPPSQ